MLPDPKHPTCQQENQPHEVLIPLETIQDRSVWPGDALACP